MKALMISIKPKNCAKIMNGKKTIEVRRNKGLYKAIQKLIKEYGFAEIYGYCSKDKETIAINPYGGYAIVPNKHKNEYFNGKVVFKFHCFKIEEIKRKYIYNELHCVVSKEWYETNTCNQEELSKKSDLTTDEIFKYLGKEIGYAIHIRNLKIFDRPKELSEFYKEIGEYHCYRSGCPYFDTPLCRHASKCEFKTKLIKAPQNFCYVEVE